jgi:hypothetical protein
MQEHWDKLSTKLNKVLITMHTAPEFDALLFERLQTGGYNKEQWHRSLTYTARKKLCLCRIRLDVPILY